MALLLEKKNGLGLITLSGSLDASVVESFSRQSAAWLESDPDLTQVVVDLGEVAFMDSAGLGALIGMLRRLAGRGGDLRLARPRPSVRLVLEITRATKIFAVFPSLGEALAPSAATP
jgi:anti-sigma B factor antagonist